MPVNARFQADFTSFYDALTRAQAQMKSFEAGAEQVEKQLNKASNAFSGVKIIQDAHVATAAMLEVGGMSALTDKEMKKLGATVNEASDKMRRMGLEVPPGFQRITDEVNQIPKAASSATEQITKLAAAFGITFSIGAVVAFGREILNTGDAIKKMADQTGLSYDQVQRLQFIASQTGVSMTTLVSAVQNLQQRLGDDNSGAAAAMKRLGINAAAFNRLGTYDQVVALSTALASETDVNQRASDGAAIFGKTWKEVGPAITANMKAIGDQAPKMADSTVDALDNIGDALDRARKQAVAWGGGVITAIEHVGFEFGNALSMFNLDHLGKTTTEVLRMQAALNDPNGLTSALLKAKLAAKTYMQEGVKPVGLSEEALASVTKDLNEKVHTSIGLNEDAARAMKKASDEYAAMARIGAGPALSWQRSLELTRFEAEKLYVVESRLFANRAAQPFTSPNLTNVPGSRTFGANPNSGDFSGVTSGPVALPTAQIEEAATKVDKLHKSLSGVEEVLGGIQTKWAQMTVVAVRAVEVVSTKLAEGDWVGAIVAAGAALGQFIVRLFKSEESAKVSPLRDVFFKAAGGLEVLNAKALQATGSLAVVQAVFDAKTVDQYNKAIQGVNEALAEYEKKVASAKGLTDGLRTKLDGIVTITPNMEAAFDAAFDAATLDGFNTALGTLTKLVDDQTQSTKELDRTMEKYGLSWTNAGDKAKAAKLGEIASGLAKDFDRLMLAGFDVNEVMRHMGKSVNDFVHDAQKSGGEVPESFKRIIQTAIDAGEVFDKDGKKITDMKELGLKFGDTMETTMKNVGLAIDRLVKVLEERLAPAIKNIPDGSFVVRGKVEFPDGFPVPDFPQKNGGGEEPPGFASGTRGRLLDFGTGTRVTLHGKEGVVTEKEAAASAEKLDSIERGIKRVGDLLQYQLPKMIRDEKLKAG